MASRYQQAKRWSYWRGFFITLALITGFAGCSSLSGYVTAALTHRARDAGVLDVLAKPLVARDIARSLADALQHAT